MLKSLFFAIKIVLLLTIVVFSYPTIGYSQLQADLSAGDPSEFYYRVLSLSGYTEENSSFTLRPFTPNNTLVKNHPWSEAWNGSFLKSDDNLSAVNIAFYSPELFQSYNSSLPRGLNDGAIWQGRGYNAAFSMGFTAKLGILHLKFKPLVGYSQNSNFDLGELSTAKGVSQFSTPVRRIDLVRRFGPDPYSWGDLGDSFIEIRYRGIRTGISNERIWTGPAIHNPLFYSYNGPGFKHVHISTYEPITTRIGNFEFKYLYGALEKSDWLDGRSDDRLNSVVSLQFAYSPSFMKGLTLGFNRIYNDVYPKGFNDKFTQVKKVFEAALKENLTIDNPGGLTRSNQLASVYYRWAFPGYGIETYGEFGRNDHNLDLRDLRLQPDHQRAYLFGLLKSFSMSSHKLLSVGFETTQLNANRTTFTRGGPPWKPGSLGSWYYHRVPNFGFTNKGQIIGAGIGPVSQAQVLYSDLFYSKGSYGLKFARISYVDRNVDSYFNRIITVNDSEIKNRWEVRNIELLTSLSTTRFVSNGLEVSATFDLSFIMNHNYVRYNDLFNARFEISLSLNIDGWL